ncbi:MAG: transposase, partial [Oligoflexales bacterium]
MKLNEIKSQIQELDFLGSYRPEKAPRIKIKLLALHHLQSGKSLKDVAEIVLYDERTVRTWIQRFIMYDYEGLLEKEGRGRHPRLLPGEEENFKITLDELQDQCRGGRKTAYDIQALLLEKFDCNYSISGVYALIDRLNIVWIPGRSKHPKNSDEAINTFKE